MDFSYVIEFLQLEELQLTLAVELQIELKEFKQFKRTFKTDKYINTTEWESIVRKIEQVLSQFNKCQENKSGKFHTDDESLTIEWKFIRKHESCINFKKLKYTNCFDWIMNVQVQRFSTTSIFDMKPNTPDVDISFDDNEYDPKESKTTSQSQYRPSRKSDTPVNISLASSEYSPKPMASPTPEVASYTPTKIESEKKPASDLHISIFGSDLEDDDHEHNNAKEVIPEQSSPTINTEKRKRRLVTLVDYSEPVYNKKTSKKKKKSEKETNEVNEHKKQPTINKWIKPGKKQEEIDSPSHSRKRKKQNNDNIDFGKIDEKEFDKINDFLILHEQQKEHKNRRRDELKEVQYLHCRDVNDDQLKQYVHKFADKIEQIYAGFTRKLKLKLNPAVMTTSNIFTENQIHFMMNQIEALRSPDEQGSKEEILTERIIPEMIIKIFAQEHNLTEEEAILRMNEMEEKRELNSSSNSNSDKPYL